MEFEGIAHTGGVKNESTNAVIRDNEIPLYAAALVGKPVCFEHELDKPVGRVTHAWVEPDGKLKIRGDVGLDDDRQLCTLMAVATGELKSLSINAAYRKNEDGTKIIWTQPLEVSLVSDPDVKGSDLCIVRFDHDRLLKAKRARNHNHTPVPHAPVIEMSAASAPTLAADGGIARPDLVAAGTTLPAVVSPVAPAPAATPDPVLAALRARCAAEGKDWNAYLAELTAFAEEQLAAKKLKEEQEKERIAAEAAAKRQLVTKWSEDLIRDFPIAVTDSGITTAQLAAALEATETRAMDDSSQYLLLQAASAATKTAHGRIDMKSPSEINKQLAEREASWTEKVAAEKERADALQARLEAAEKEAQQANKRLRDIAADPLSAPGGRAIKLQRIADDAVRSASAAVPVPVEAPAPIAVAAAHAPATTLSTKWVEHARSIIAPDAVQVTYGKRA